MNNTKGNLGRKCLNLRLVLIDAIELQPEEGDELESLQINRQEHRKETSECVTVVEHPMISLHAITRSLNPETMIFKDKVGSQWLVILVYISNIQCFLNPTVTRRGNFQIIRRRN